MVTAVDETTEVKAAGPRTNGSTRKPKLLNAAAILSAEDIRTDDVDVPEWGGLVRVKALTGEQRNKIGALMRVEGKRLGSEDEALAMFQVRIIAAAAVDENGERLFSQDDVARLAKKSAGALQRVYEAAAGLSGIGEYELDKARADLNELPSWSSGSD